MLEQECCAKVPQYMAASATIMLGMAWMSPKAIPYYFFLQLAFFIISLVLNSTKEGVKSTNKKTSSRKSDGGWIGMAVAIVATVVLGVVLMELIT